MLHFRRKFSSGVTAAFEDLKTAVTTALVLVSPQELDPFWIEADNSDFATGAVLSQQSTTDGK